MTTWNSADKSANISLSNGDLTATATSASDGGVRGTSSKSTGKLYVEFTVGANFGTADGSFGITTGSSNLATIGVNGASGFYVYQQSGNIWASGSSTGKSLGGYTTGDVVSMAVDFTNMRGWFRKNGGNWNNDGTADPATNTGGVDISGTFGSAAAYLVQTSNNNGAAATLNCGAQSLSRPMPSGFDTWDTQSTLVFTIKGTGAGSMVAPVGKSLMDAEAWGGGAAGTGISSTSSPGGSGGGYSKYSTSVTAGSTTVYWTVGVGGTGGSGLGGAGGKSWVNAAANSEPASNGCVGGGAASTGTSAAGTPGAGTIGTTNFSGGSGASGAGGSPGRGGGGGGGAGTANNGSNASGFTHGAGGASDGGDGTDGTSGATVSTVGAQPGGGSGGAWSTNAGNGGAGQVRLTFTSSGTTLEPTLVTDTDAFHQPTVSPGAITATPGLVTDSDSTHQPTASASYTLTAGLFADTDSFYQPSLSQADILLAGLVTDTDSFHQPTVTAGSISLVPSLVADADTVFSPSASAGDVTLAPSLVASTDVFFSPSAVSSYGLAVSLVTDADSFHQPTATISDYALVPALVASDDSVFAPTAVPGPVSALSSLVVDADAFHAPSAVARYPLVAALYSDADSFYSPSLSAANYLAPSLVSAADAIYAVTLNGTVVLSPPFVDSDAMFYLPTDAANYTATAELYVDADVVHLPSLAGGSVSILPSRVVDGDIFLTSFVNNEKKNGQGSGGSGGSVPSDIKYASQLTMTESGLVIALECVASTAKTINTRMMIYADTGANLPGALLGQSAVKTSVVAGSNQYPLVVPASVLNGQKVWVALHSDGNFNWFLTPSTGGAKYNTDLFSDGPSDPFGSVSNDNKKAPVFLVYLASASAGMTPGLVVDSDGFYAPAITGRKTLLPSLVSDTDFFYDASGSQFYYLAPDYVSDADVVYVPSLARSSLLPGLVASDDQFYGPFFGINSPNFDVFGADVSSDDMVHQATVTLFGAGLPPGLVVDADTAHVPVVTVEYQLGASLASDSDIFYVPTLASGSVTLVPETVLGGEDFFDPVIEQQGGATAITPQLHVDDDIFYRPSNGRRNYRRQIYLDGQNDREVELVGVATEDA